MKKNIKHILSILDDRLVRPGIICERPRVISLLFHGFYVNQAEVNSGIIDPNQNLTEEYLKQIIDLFHEAGYRFVSPVEILNMKTDQKSVFLTFDDGYANNLRLPSVLKSHGAKATVFISTAHVLNQKAFWWDVLYRKRKGVISDGDYIRELSHLKTLTYREVESFLLKSYGADAMKCIGDLDRPMSVGELKEFAKHESISIGNHTMDHAILPNLDVSDITSQIRGAQSMITNWTGQSPLIIAYPDGRFDSRVLKAAKLAGLKLGLTTVPGKNPISHISNDSMTLFRHNFVCDQDIKHSVDKCRSEFQLTNFINIYIKRRMGTFS